MSFSGQNLAELFQLAVKHKASDIHIRTGEVPCLRLRGDLLPIQSKKLSADDISDIIKIIAPKDIDNQDINELDGGFVINGLCRVRFNIFNYSNGMGIIFRIISRQVPTLDSLNLSPALARIADTRRGLILVTGATGSGKSTTLAAMIDHINETRKSHIITVEDPIEYVHQQKSSRITQREVGRDTEDFNTALRSSLRQDPDVILIGEMRDTETISTALKASETGHVVFSTVHTTDAITSIGRIISMFPAAEQEDIRKRLSENLHATISQRMIPGKDRSVYMAQEIMITGPGVKECIIGKEPLSRIAKIIEEDRGDAGKGSQSFDQHIMELYKQGKITKEVALQSASNQSDFMKDLEFE